LLISGVPEEIDEDIISVVQEIIDTKLEFESVARILVAYRLGRIIKPRAPHLPQSTKPKHRSILVTFPYASDVEMLISIAHKLKGSGIGFSRDYPREITDARKALWDEFKENRAKFGPKNVHIKFPAALVVNSRVIKDMFPDWHNVLRGVRDMNTPRRISQALKVRYEVARKIYDEHTQRHHESKLDDAIDLENVIMSEASQCSHTSSNSDSESAVGDHQPRPSTPAAEAPKPTRNKTGKQPKNPGRSSNAKSVKKPAPLAPNSSVSSVTQGSTPPILVNTSAPPLIGESTHV
jgi:hypothetical protein